MLRHGMIRLTMRGESLHEGLDTPRTTTGSLILGHGFLGSDRAGGREPGLSS